MSLSRVLPNVFGQDSFLLHPAFVVPLIALAAAYAFHSRQSPVKAAPVAAGAPQVPDPDPYTDFDIKTAKTRDHIYVNKVREPRSPSPQPTCR